MRKRRHYFCDRSHQRRRRSLRYDVDPIVGDHSLAYQLPADGVADGDDAVGFGERSAVRNRQEQPLREAVVTSPGEHEEIVDREYGRAAGVAGDDVLRRMHEIHLRSAQLPAEQVALSHAAPNDASAGENDQVETGESSPELRCTSRRHDRDELDVVSLDELAEKLARVAIDPSFGPRYRPKSETQLVGRPTLGAVRGGKGFEASPRRSPGRSSSHPSSTSPNWLQRQPM